VCRKGAAKVRTLARIAIKTYLLAIIMVLPSAGVVAKRLGRLGAGSSIKSTAERYHEKTNQFLKENSEEVDFLETSGRATLRRFSS